MNSCFTHGLTFLQWGLTISTKKTTVLVVGRDAEAQTSDANITTRGGGLGFKYLGSIFTSDGTLDAEIARRPRLCHYQQRCNFSSQLLCQFYCIGVKRGQCLANTWGPLSTFQINCLRRFCGISRIAHVPNVEILARCHTISVESQLKTKRLRWFGHVCRMPDTRLPKKVLYGQVTGRGLLDGLGKPWMIFCCLTPRA